VYDIVVVLNVESQVVQWLSENEVTDEQFAAHSKRPKHQLVRAHR
jgi:hypothetical protein